MTKIDREDVFNKVIELCADLNPYNATDYDEEGQAYADVKKQFESNPYELIDQLVDVVNELLVR